ncbi:DUF4431 domain-containing protein [Citrobacter braakii]|uniref:DUF4431 domain-containing protein n=1 Tax=Citrobacter braakii TaxID=57706 RepID=UPI003CC64550
MKYLWLSALLFSHAVLAWCPDEDQQVTLQGTLIQQTLPGSPNYESIKDGDKAVTYDYLKLDQPFECDVNGERENVPLVQIILMGKNKLNYADLAPSLGKDVILTGKTMYAQTGHHFTSVLLILYSAKNVTPITTAEQKKSALLQFQQFQQALREKNVVALKTYFVFPLQGTLFDFIDYDENRQEDVLTETVFDQNSQQIMAHLQMLASIGVDAESLMINEYRINALSEHEQQRRYFPADEDGMFYYEEHGKRHTVKGTCDTVAQGELTDGILFISQGTGPNTQLPGLSEYCDGATSYMFKLVDGKLRLMGSFTAG